MSTINLVPKITACIIYPLHSQPFTRLIISKIISRYLHHRTAETFNVYLFCHNLFFEFFILRLAVQLKQGISFLLTAPLHLLNLTNNLLHE